MNSIENLAEFYKHCLNITANQRPNYNACPLFSGWMRCYITPYLINNEVDNTVSQIFKDEKGEEFCKFKNLLLYTLKDYIDYFSMIGTDNNVIHKTTNLISYLSNMSETDIIYEIENNCDIFPSYNSCDHELVIPESYNLTLINDLQIKKEQEQQELEQFNLTYNSSEDDEINDNQQNNIISGP